MQVYGRYRCERRGSSQPSLVGGKLEPKRDLVSMSHESALDEAITELALLAGLGGHRDV